MKTLICGNGPSLLTQLKGKTLALFDNVVRINQWRSIPGYDNRCDTWVFFPKHGIYTDQAFAYNFKPYVNTKKHWLVHSWAQHEAKLATGRYPDLILPEEYFLKMNDQENNKVATTGVLAILLATLVTKNVWIAGFDFFEGDQTYYYKPGKCTPPEVLSSHTMHKDKAWVNNQIKEGRVRLL